MDSYYEKTIAAILAIEELRRKLASHDEGSAELCVDILRTATSMRTVIQETRSLKTEVQSERQQPLEKVAAQDAKLDSAMKQLTASSAKVELLETQLSAEQKRAKDTERELGIVQNLPGAAIRNTFEKFPNHCGTVVSLIPIS